MNHQKRQATLLHNNDCPDCLLGDCGRLIFATCNLEAQSGVKAVMRRVGRELIKNTSKFIDLQKVRQNRDSKALTEAYTEVGGLDMSIDNIREKKKCCS